MELIKKLFGQKHGFEQRTPGEWFNLGAAEFNRGDFRDAASRFLAGYEAAYASPDMQKICAFAYALSRQRTGEDLSVDLLPNEVRGEFGQVICAFTAQNIANHFRKDGHKAHVGPFESSSRTITAEIEGSRYILRVIDSLATLGKVLGNGGRIVTVGRVKRQKELDIWDADFERTATDQYVIGVFERGLKGVLPIADIAA